MPPGALVIAVTPLLDPRAIAALLDLANELFDQASDSILIADMHGSAEFEALREIDASRPRQLGAEHGGEQARSQEAVGDALLENGAGGEIVVQMDGIDVAGDIGEGEDVVIADFLGIARFHADGEVLEIVAVP